MTQITAAVVVLVAVYGSIASMARSERLELLSASLRRAGDDHAFEAFEAKEKSIAAELLAWVLVAVELFVLLMVGVS